MKMSPKHIFYPIYPKYSNIDIFAEYIRVSNLHFFSCEINAFLKIIINLAKQLRFLANKQYIII